MIEKNKKVSEILNIFSLFPQLIESITYNKNEFQYIETDPFIENKIKYAENILGENSRIIIRASGTEHKLRVMGEASNKVLLSKTLKNLKLEIKNYIND